MNASNNDYWVEPWRDSHRAVSSRLTPAQLRQGAAVVQPASYGPVLRDTATVAPTRFVGTDGPLSYPAVIISSVHD